ncbi:unnamed protein product [Nippostrongylus brasiliensis]|uniref:Secreted protein n=1 Tax=Nippostrongylus brasiliensis TaxID=27835 RepID=A0A0N4Y9D5_NIPBR|nr:unnamed protein product [Nippostrongylus brasiliensis]
MIHEKPAPCCSAAFGVRFCITAVLLLLRISLLWLPNWILLLQSVRSCSRWSNSRSSNGSSARRPCRSLM